MWLCMQWYTIQQKKGTEYWYYNMDEPQKHGKWKKPDAKDYIMSDPMYMKRPAKANS